MATAPKPIKGRPYPFRQGLISQANANLLKVNPTIAAGDFKISIDGGAFANLANLPAASPAGSASVGFSLTAAEMTGDSIVIIGSDQAGAEWADFHLELATKDPSIANFPFLMRDNVGSPAPAKTVTAYYSYDGVAWAALAGTITETANGWYRIPLTLAVMAGYTDAINLRFTAPGCQDTDITLLNPF